MPREPSRPSESGQAAVELVALLPVLVAALAVAWQFLLAAHAAWSAAVAARAAARAHAVGLDAAAAARAHLPPSLERSLQVRPEQDGTVEVSVRIPEAIRGLSLGRTSAAARFEPQNR